MGRHLVAAQYPFDQQLHLATGGFLAKQAGVDNFGVVKHHEVAGAQQTRQVFEAAVHRGGAGAVQQAGARALGGRMLGNQGFWEFEIKVAQGEGTLGAGEESLHGA